MKNVLLVLLTVLGAATLLEAQPYYLRSEEPQCDFGNSNGTCELTDPDMDGIFELVTDWNGFTIGRKEFKIYDAGADQWYPGGSNAWFDHQGGNMTFRFYTSNNTVEAVDNGPFSYCAPGQWNGFNPLGAPMTNVGGNDWCYTVATPGSYEWKPVVCNGGPFGFDSWQPNTGERSVNSANWFITTTVANEQVCITADPTTGRVLGSTPPPTGYYLRSSAAPCTFSNFDLGCQLEDGDNDGVFELTTDFGGGTLGRQEFKIYHADTDTWYPSGPNAWYNHPGGSMTFKFYTATGEVEAIENEPFAICAPGQWSGFDPNTPMQDMGNGVFCYNVASPGTYEWKPVVCGGFDSWQPGNGERSVNSANWEITTVVADQQFCITYNLANGRVSPASVTAVPTMGQWGMILFALIMLALGMVILSQQKMVMAGTKNNSFSLRSLPFDKAFFGKALMVTGVIFVAAFAIGITVFGYEMTNADVPGSLLTIPLIAYIALLIRGGANK